jgi:indole-3-acetate monooxygenase
MSTTTGTPLDRVERIAPVIREHARLAERGHRPAAPVLQAMRAQGLFRLLLPASLGGEETDPVSFAIAVETIARADTAAAWVMQAASIGDWWGARFPDDGVEEVFGGDPDQLMAAAFHPPMTGVAVDGGFRIAGRRPLASNIHDARWLFVTAVVGDGAIGAIVPATEAEVVDTWDSLGMRGTDSNDVVLDDVFVPARRTTPLMPGFTPGAHHRGPLYRMPAVAILSAVLAPIALAVAREALEALRDLAAGKTSLGSGRPLAARQTVQARVGRAEGMLRAARHLFYDTLTASWERAVSGAPVDLTARAGDLLAGTHAVQTSVRAVDMAFSLAGSDAVYERSPIERCFRDVQTLRHHGFVNESRYEAVGQVLLGVEPEFALVAF